MEVWKPYFQTGYDVSDLGNVRNSKNGRVLKSWRTGSGYRKIQIGPNRFRFRVHRLIAEIFCEKKNGCLEIDHINKIRTDNRACNLEWVTHKENCQRKFI